MLIFGVYGGITLCYGKLKKNEQKETNRRNEKVKFEPFVSVVVPTHNEEMIISKKIDAPSSLNVREPVQYLLHDKSEKFGSRRQIF